MSERVDFMIIGAQKCGTTTLAEILAAHPRICFSSTKEPHYFATHPDWRPGLDGYHRLFGGRGDQIWGEASTSYTFLPEHGDVAARLYDYNPDLRFYYLVRHPVARIESQYQHDVLRGRTNEPPEAVVTEDTRYVERSRYAFQIRPYIERFGRDRVRIFLLEEFGADPEPALRTIAEDLEIDAGPLLDADRSARNASAIQGHRRRLPGLELTKRALLRSSPQVRQWAKKMLHGPLRPLLYRRGERRPFSESLRADLWTRVADDVRAMEGLLGRPLPWS